MSSRQLSLLITTLAASLALAACNNSNNGFNNGQNSSSPAAEVPAAPTAHATGDAAADGQAFLAANKSKDGVQTTASGLQYKINQPGSGKSPAATDIVSVEYEGRLLNGTVFDSTAKHGGQPVSFPVNQVIAGWTEGLQLMKEGGEYTFFIPANLAYGAREIPGAIPANSTLVFDVKLIKVGE